MVASYQFPHLLRQVFARKLLRLSETEVTSVENELRASKKLCQGTNIHIIEVFATGKFISNHDHSTCVFIDMELCYLNLEQYNKGSALVDLVHGNGSEDRERKIWNIMKQITDALVFIHGKHEVHRDLKPENGMHLESNHNMLILIQYSIPESKTCGNWLTSD